MADMNDKNTEQNTFPTEGYPFKIWNVILTRGSTVPFFGSKMTHRLLRVHPLQLWVFSVGNDIQLAAPDKDEVSASTSSEGSSIFKSCQRENVSCA